MRTRGVPPKNLTGGKRVRSLDSPWWNRVMSELVSSPGIVGRTLSIEEITEMIPSYPDGRRPRPQAVSRRLRSILELVSRGPNGSRSKQAIYRIRSLPVEIESVARKDTDDVVIGLDNNWLLEQVERMTKGK